MIFTSWRRNAFHGSKNCVAGYKKTVVTRPRVQIVTQNLVQTTTGLGWAGWTGNRNDRIEGFENVSFIGLIQYDHLGLAWIEIMDIAYVLKETYGITKRVEGLQKPLCD